MMGSRTPDAQPGAVQWRLFLRAMADEIDESLGTAARDALLRAAGARMARLAPLSAVGTLDALELEMNDALAAMGWGRASLAFDDAARELHITHHNLPQVGTAGDPPGTWLAALLEGMYETWLAQQPGAEPGLHARQTEESGAEQVRLRYARGSGDHASVPKDSRMTTAVSGMARALSPTEKSRELNKVTPADQAAPLWSGRDQRVGRGGVTV